MLAITEASQYVWHDATGEAHTVTQAEGGEQGDPLTPALFALGQRSALKLYKSKSDLGSTFLLSWTTSTHWSNQPVFAQSTTFWKSI